MKHSRRIAYVAAAVAVMLVACRGVLGIEDLEVVKDGGTSNEGGVDAPGDRLVVGDVVPDVPISVFDAGCQSKTGSSCGSCCHMALGMQFEKLQQTAFMQKCVCGGAACGGPTECGETLCKMDGGMEIGCGACVDMQTKMPAPGACTTAAEACERDPNCRDARPSRKSPTSCPGAS